MKKKKFIRETVPEYRQGIRNIVNRFLAEEGYYIGTTEPARKVRHLEKEEIIEIKFERWKRKTFGENI